MWNHHAVEASTERTLHATTQNTSIDASREYSLTEGQQFRNEYDRACQIIFSRVQEHHHQPGKGKLIPLRSCLSAKCKTKCKHGFPKLIVLKATVICEGQSEDEIRKQIREVLLISLFVFKVV